MSKTPKLHFLHIPKTAGTSVTQFLQRQYDLSEIVFETTWRKLFKYEPRMQKLRLFRGHFGINLNKMLGPEFKTITFLRNPITRVLSQYHHIRETPTEGLHNVAKTMNLEEFIFHRQGRKLCRNLQARYIGLDIEIATLWAKPASVNLPQDAYFENLAAPQILANAKSNLDRFLLVGLTEYYDISMLLLCHKLGVRPEPNATKRRARDWNPERFSKETLEHLKGENQLDAELYEYGKTLLVHSLASEFRMPDILEMTPGNALACVEDRKEDLLNTCVARYENRMREQQRQSWSWDATRALQGTGWWDVHGRLGETPHRWSGPETSSTIDVPVNPSAAYEIVIRILQFMKRNFRKEFKVLAPSGQISLSPKKQNGEWAFHGIIQPQEITNPYLRLTFQVPDTLSMAYLGLDPNDTDERGFALRAVSLEPLGRPREE